MVPARSLMVVALAGTLLAIGARGALADAPRQALRGEQARLAEADAAARAAQARAAALEAEAARERDAAQAARAREAAAGERIRAAQAAIDAATARIAIFDRLQAVQRQRLAAAQAPIVRLVAALQSMARRPAALGLVQPGSLRDVVHARAVLATAIPQVAARTRTVREEIGRAAQYRRGAAQALAGLAEGRARIEAERIALVRLEAAHRLRAESLGRTALIESDRAIAAGERARDIVDQMQAGDDARAVGRALAMLPGPLLRPDAPGVLPRLPARGAYRLPVRGALVTGFGEIADSGVRARGLTLACAAGSGVVAPAGGTVAYAGPFRGYGSVVILDHGGGWTTLIAGLGPLAVKVGARVAAGATLGEARGGVGEGGRITVELRRRGVPMDLTQMLS